jgi:iron complex transport system substrate-binding protein
VKRALAFVVLAAALSPGCRQAEIVGGKPRPKQVQSIVSLSPGTTDILFKVGMISLVRGKTASCDSSYGLQNAEIVVSGTTPQYDKIVQLQPDLVVYDAKLYSQAETDKLKELGLNTLALDADTVDGLIEFLFEVGKATGAESNASNLADKIYAARTVALAQAPDPRPTVAVVTGGEAFYVAGKDSFIADVVRSSGGEPVAMPGNRFATAGPEQLLKLAPDVVFTTAGDGVKILNDRRLQSLPAVRNKQVYDIDPDTLLRVSTRIETLIEPMSNRLRAAKRGQA